MQMSLYIYYRVRPDCQAQARPIALAMLAAIRAATACNTQLAQRCDDPCTWMEIYTEVADREALLASIAREFIASGLASLMEEKTSRHIECFQSL